MARRSTSAPPTPHPLPKTTAPRTITPPPPVRTRGRNPQHRNPQHPRPTFVHDDTTGLAQPAAQSLPRPSSTDHPPAVRRQPQPNPLPPPRADTANPPTTRTEPPPAKQRRTVPASSGPPTTLGEMAQRALAFAAGSAAHAVVDDDVPETLAGHLAEARQKGRGKATSENDRRIRTPRYFATLINHLELEDARPTTSTIEALACAYIHYRLRRPPPFGWRPCEAPALMSDLSSYAETLRMSRLVPDVPQYCGTAPQRECERRGGKDRPEHSHALPLHLSMLLRTPIPKCPRQRKAREFLIIMAFFCLRTGIVFMLRVDMFVPYAGGFLLIWRFATKRGGGDQTRPGDTLPTTRKVHYTAARDPWLNEFFKHAKGPMFHDVEYDDLNAFIKDSIPQVPHAFDLRVYGCRVAADTEATEMKAPPRLINMSFDWKPVKKKMSNHYSGNNILLMYKLSHERAHNLEVVSIAPAMYAVVYRGTNLPTWDMPTLPPGTPLPPAPDPATIDAAWNAPAPVRRIAAARGRRPVASGAGEPDPPRQPSPTLSIDCAECDAHVGRTDVAAMCEVPICRWGKCLECFPDLATELWCPEHAKA